MLKQNNQGRAWSWAKLVVAIFNSSLNCFALHLSPFYVEALLFHEPKSISQYHFKVNRLSSILFALASALIIHFLLPVGYTFSFSHERWSRWVGFMIRSQGLSSTSLYLTLHYQLTSVLIGCSILAPDSFPEVSVSKLTSPACLLCVPCNCITWLETQYSM